MKKTRRGKFSEISGIFRISEIPKFGKFSEIFRKFRKFRKIPEIVPGKSIILEVSTNDYSLKPGKNPRIFPPKPGGNPGKSGKSRKFRKFREIPEKYYPFSEVVSRGASCHPRLIVLTCTAYVQQTFTGSKSYLITPYTVIAFVDCYTRGLHGKSRSMYTF